MLREPFEAFMKKRLLGPFGMPTSGYVWSSDIASLMTRPHDASGKAMAQNRSSAAAVARYGSAGALLSSSREYARFLIEVLAAKPADDTRLRPETVREMLRPQVKLESSDIPSSWALGWQLFHGPARDFIFHGGNNRGFHSAAIGSVAGRSGYVAMTNGDGGPAVLRNLLTFGPVQEFLAA